MGGFFKHLATRPLFQYFAFDECLNAGFHTFKIAERVFVLHSPTQFLSAIVLTITIMNYKMILILYREVNTMKKILKASYNVIIIFLALFSVALVLLDFSEILDLNAVPWIVIDNVILIIFTVDYFTRLFKSNNKKQFFKSNIFDLIAIIPFNAIFSIFRFSRLFRLAKVSSLTKLIKAARIFRALGFLGILKKRLDKFLHTNGFIYVLYCAGALIFMSSLAMSYIEHKSFGDALWWSIVTTTTVGYGDISPVTPMGRMIAIILMIFGIGMIGMLTGTITTYFANRTEHKIEAKSDCSALIKIAQTLTDNQIAELTAIAQALKSVK